MSTHHSRVGNKYLEFPEGTDGTFPEDEVGRREIVLGKNTTNTCNIAIADVDGDGLDEIATPITIGEDDCVCLYRGDGRLVWKNSKIQLYHAFYNDPTRPAGGIGHMWYKSKHRHVLTEIVDFDKDGKLEVVVGDGPIYILDGLTGDIKLTIDLGGRVSLWNVVYDPKIALNILVAAADNRTTEPEILGIDPSGKKIWSVPTPGRGFCDCMHNGDLNIDRRPEIGLSIEEVKEFWMIDCDGKILWKKNVPEELGDDPHVDDFLIDQILPKDRIRGKQVLLVTGPNLLDQNGNIIWSARDRFHHAQKVIAANFHPQRPGKEVYIVESYKRRAHLLTCDGETIWDYNNFTRLRGSHRRKRVLFPREIGRLTTAGDLINWSGNGKLEIVQSEVGGENTELQDGKTIPPESLRRFMHVLDKNGNAVSIFPIEDSPMCARSAMVTDSPGEDIVMVGHDTSKIYIFYKKNTQ